MLNRTVILRLMFVALGATALLGVAAVLTRDEEVLWQMAGTAMASAIACGLLCCWSLLGSVQAFRTAAPMLSIVTAIELLMIVLLIWSEVLPVNEFALALSLVIITYAMPTAILGLVLSQYEWGRRSGWTGFGATTGAAMLGCIALWIDNNTEEILGISAAATSTSGWIAALILLQPYRPTQARLCWWRLAGLFLAAIFGLLWIGWVVAWGPMSITNPPPMFMDAMTTAGVLAAASGVSGLLEALAMPLKSTWLKRSTLICAWTTLLIIGSLVFRENHNNHIPDDDLMFRGALSLGIVTLCGIVACLCLTAISTALRRARAGSGLLRFNCPVCHMKQTITTGEHPCPQCETIVRFHFEVTRCQECHYPRKGWTTEACPECGWIIGSPTTTPA